jgi:hypothetical protein
MATIAFPGARFVGHIKRLDPTISPCFRCNNRERSRLLFPQTRAMNVTTANSP